MKKQPETGKKNTDIKKKQKMSSGMNVWRKAILLSAENEMIEIDEIIIHLA
jgi:hypothetical protein